MIATFVIDWFVVMLIGIVFGAFAPRTGWWQSRAFIAGLVSAAAFTGVALASYAVAPDWMWMYFLDPSDVGWAVPLIAPAYLFVYALSFGGAIALKQLGRAVVWGAAAIAAAMEVAVIGLTWDRYRLVGTLEEWRSGVAHELFSASPSGPAKTIGLVSPVFIVILLVSLFLAWRGTRETAADR